MFESLAHYKILDRIGAGGLGELYRARDTRLGRTVAIRVVDADIAGDTERRERLLIDARASVALSHPSIAALYEIGEDQDQLFLACEFVPGETLHAAIGGRPLNPRRAIDLATQIADALADAHAAGAVHRDIQPDNIIVTPKGRAKILDFGLASWTGGGAAREQAAGRATDTPAGARQTPRTVAYMSPEQALGEPVDHRTDIFSLGVVLFEMLTGRLPFVRTTAADTPLQIVQAPAPALSSANASLPREVDAIVRKALAKSLDQRYESAATLAAELRSLSAILDVRVETAEVAAPAVPRARSRSGAPWVWIAIALIVIAGALAWYAWPAVLRLWHAVSGQ